MTTKIFLTTIEEIKDRLQSDFNQAQVDENGACEDIARLIGLNNYTEAQKRLFEAQHKSRLARYLETLIYMIRPE